MALYSVVAPKNKLAERKAFVDSVATESDNLKYNFWLWISLAMPIKCFVSHRPVSCDGGSVGRAKKKKKRMKTLCSSLLLYIILNLTFNR